MPRIMIKGGVWRNTEVCDILLTIAIHEYALWKSFGSIPPRRKDFHILVFLSNLAALAMAWLGSGFSLKIIPGGQPQPLTLYPSLSRALASQTLTLTAHPFSKLVPVTVTPRHSSTRVEGCQF